MKSILLIQSSPSGTPSYSNLIAYQLIEDLKAAYPAAKVVIRDVSKESLPHVKEHFVSGRGLPLEKRSQAEVLALETSDKLIDELMSADLIVIAAPMHNFGVPSSLKAWVDHVVRPGFTFSYSEKGVEGLVKNKKAILVLASGGVYSSGPMKALDFQEPYLRGVLGFIGISNIDVIRIEGVAMGPDAVQRAIKGAKSQVAESVRNAA